MNAQLEKHFEKMGAKLNIITVSDVQRARRSVPFSEPYEIDVVESDQGEYFEIRLNKRFEDRLDLNVLEVRQKDRHLVLLARELDQDGNAVRKDHLLCGHDERHWFVASVSPVSTVNDAKDSLKPMPIRRVEVGLKAKKRNRRKTENFKRQGEWFFLPETIYPDEHLILRDEPLVRDSMSKPHMAQFCYRHGGEAVKVCSRYPQGLTIPAYKKLIARKPSALKWGWREMRRNAAVYVKGKIRHADHATITLNQWHRVLMNTESTSERVVFLD